MRRHTKQRGLNTTTLIIGIGFIVVLVLTGYISYQFIFFNSGDGCGFNDGPFEGEKILVALDTLNIEETLDFEHGRLAVVNGDETDCPVLLLYDNESLAVKWAIAMNTKLKPEYEHTHLSRIESLAAEKTQTGFVVHLLAVWTYGAESGRVVLDSKGEFKYFCLSW